MKKSFNSWKLLTLLSSLIFAMSCWYFVYAANFKTPSGIWMDLDSSEWNSVVDYLVPSWAVMAFNLSSCPDWWSSYTPAEGRVIIGGYSRNVWDTWWEDYHYLTISEMPSHSHYMYVDATSTDDGYDHDWSSYKQNYVVRENEHEEGDGNYSYTMAAYIPKYHNYSYKTPTVWKSQEVWNGYAFDNRSAFVKLLYCQKN
jgi:hypothetical protein